MFFCLICVLFLHEIYQSYIQDALVTPRLREAKKAAKAAAAGAVAPPPVPVQTEAVEPTVSSAESEVPSTGSKAPPSKGEASAARGASTVGEVGEKGASLKKAANGVAQAEDADEEDDGDAEVYIPQVVYMVVEVAFFVVSLICVRAT